ncbi:MAG: DUF421 domain-containing protein [Oscillospiraceae bacterium]|nr:DUF421 domain-containing protein [Oscillospiraceae bacterium]
MLISYIRAAALYAILFACVRLMGKRQVGEMEPSEVVITMLLANLAAIPMQDAAIPLAAGLVPILVVFSLELIVSYLCMRSIRLRRLLCGKPVILIENGKLLQHSLRKTRVTVDELTEHLRERGIISPEQVKYAILETNGQISAFPFGCESQPNAQQLGVKAEDPQLPWTLISDGRILRANLRAAGRTHGWLEAQLRKKGLTASEVFLLTVDPTGKQYLIEKERNA